MTLFNIIEEIKKRRKILNVTQETLSEISGIGLRTLKQIERGKGNPTLLTLEKICDALGLEVLIKVQKSES